MTSPPRLVILGAGGHARDLLATATALQRTGAMTHQTVGFLVDAAHRGEVHEVCGLPVLGGLEWLAGEDARGLVVACGIGSPAARWRIVARAAAQKVEFVTLVHPAAVQVTPAELGEGAYVAAGAVLASGVRVGAHAHLDAGCTLGHDVEVGELAGVAPGANLAGRVRVGAGSFVGLGANVLQDVVVGEWSIVGAGSVVLADVPPNVTVAGSPARVVRRHQPGWQTDERRGDPF